MRSTEFLANPGDPKFAGHRAYLRQRLEKSERGKDALYRAAQARFALVEEGSELCCDGCDPNCICHQPEG